MAFEIVLAPQAVEDLRSIRANLRSDIRAAMETHLRHEPQVVSRSRIKRLRGLRQPQFRLRVGPARIFYDADEWTVFVLAIFIKKDAQAWLERFGRTE
jgi:mRNA-degrading endonuclease RelE of RelBE toxin-antitoxin system